MAPNKIGKMANEPLELEGHRKPVSRRDFLARGLMAATATIASPSLFGLLRDHNAYAASVTNCNVAGGADRIPFLGFDLAGGANIAGSNVLVGGPGGQLDPLTPGGYLKLGLRDDQDPALPGMFNDELGLLFHTDSAFLRGILLKTSPETRAMVNGSVICARSENDTQNNPHNPIYGINKAGAQGNLITLAGTSNSDSGGKSMAPMSMMDPTVKPVRITRPQDVMGLVDTGKLVQLLNENDAAKVMNAITRISDQKLGHMTETQVVQDILHCSYEESEHLVATFGDPNNLNPLNDPLIIGDGVLPSIFTAQDLDDSNRFERTASVMKLVANGHAGAGTVELGGYDYHDSTRATGERRDFEAGQCVGAALEYAARLGQQLMIYVFSDGSVVGDDQLDMSAEGMGKPVWRSDNTGTAAVFMLAIDPTQPGIRPQLTSPAAAQIGHFRTSGSVETSATRISNNVGILAEAIVANYLALHDDLGRLGDVLPGHGLGDAAEVDTLVAFQPIRSTV